MEHKINLFDYYKIFRDYLVILIKRFYIVLAVIVCFFIIALIYTRVATRIYITKSVVLPLGAGGGGDMGLGAKLTAQFAGVPMAAEGSKKLNLLLRSRTLSERVAQKLNLDKVYHVSIESAASMILHNSQVIFMEQEGDQITFIVQDTDPELAANINKVFLSELQNYINENSFTSAKRQRIYVEQQLVQRRKELLELGKEASEFYRKNRISAVASITDVEVTPNFIIDETNMETMTQNIEEEQNQLNSLEKQPKDNKVIDVPQQVYLEYLRQKKNELTRIVALLSQQYEMAKMEEAKEDIAFQVIDEARVPHFPARPNVKVILMLSIFLGFFAGVFCAFLMEYILRIKKNVKST